ncbi:MAG TPA: TIGR02996 domain-containing protein [Thermoanaerobaculia bacterium]|jgi:uncharacterized protein (TIGR02996 family)|nr:TIGR02996 domain-containing protein [Thermoanaerobaculia bacterium]
MDEEELLSDVARDPDDVVARLNYALWCDAQPDPSQRARGDFIRLQIELADVQLGRARGDAQTLREHTYRLSNRHGAEWAGELRDLVEQFEFHRGFIELVALPAAAFLERAQRLFTLAPIRHLNVTKMGTSIDELFASPDLERLRSLSVEGCGLTDRDMFVIARSQRLRALRWLSVAQNRVGEAGATALADSPYLQDVVYIAFHGNEFEPNERYSYDDGFVVDSWLPEDGVKLESELGRTLPWLHHSARSMADSVPNRFLAADQKSSGSG